MNPSDQNTNSHDPRSNPANAESLVADKNTQLYGETPSNVQPKTKQSKNRFKGFKNPQLKGLFGILQIVIGAVVAAFIINTFVFQSYEVVGDSMKQTLSDGDRLIINKLGNSWSSLWRNEYIPKRGEIIVFDDPGGSGRQLVKRVIGIAGDTVDIQDGVITIYNEENPEGFNPDQELGYGDTLTIDTNYSLRSKVDDGHLFVAGDNRVGGASFDSRNDLGQVKTDLVVGNLILRLLPLSESRFF